MTSLGDIRLAAQQRADRVKGPMTTEEWNYLVNASAAELYRTLTSTYEDYNVKPHDFALTGGDGGNFLLLGAGSQVPRFDKLRHIAQRVQPMSTSTQWAPVLKADSAMHFDELSAPVLAPWGNYVFRLYYWLYGNRLEIRPSASAGTSYRLYYVPAFQKLVNDDDAIDGTWMATSGIDEFIVLGAAAKALIKEESLDTASLILQEQKMLRTDILSQFSNRDDNQPGRIVDVKRARGFMGAGWGRQG